MITTDDPDKYVSFVRSNLCQYHKFNPGGTWAGCTCSAVFGQRVATPEEREQNRKAREERELRHGEALAQIYGFNL